VPFRFILPPRIAKPTSFVSPVPHASFSALGNHGTSAETTLARKIGLSFLALSVYESKFHVSTWLVVAARAVPMQRHGSNVAIRELAHTGVWL